MIENEGAVTGGCYSEFQNGREVEVCVCRSTHGEMPCNTGKSSSYFRLGIIFVVLLNMRLFTF